MGRGLLPVEESLEGIPARTLQAVPRTVQTVWERTSSTCLLAWISAFIRTKQTNNVFHLISFNFANMLLYSGFILYENNCYELRIY